jgi:hypothetical protein
MWCGITPDVGRGIFLGMRVGAGATFLSTYVAWMMQTARTRTYNEFATYSPSHCHLSLYVLQTQYIQPGSTVLRILRQT